MGDPRIEARVTLDISLVHELDESAGSFYATVGYVHEVRRRTCVRAGALLFHQ